MRNQFHLKHDSFDESTANGNTKPITFSLVLDKPPDSKLVANQN